MKRVVTCLLLLTICHYSFAQESRDDAKRNNTVEEQHGFDINRVFTGGGISLGYGTTSNGDNSTTSSFNIGAIPEIGYSLSEIFDLGIATSINYTSSTNSYYDAKQHNTSYSLGAFVRIHPINDFFIQAMPEQDWSNYKVFSGGYTNITKIKSNSFLVGIGYGHRIIGESYFYTLLMLDLGRDKYSPYLDYNPNSNSAGQPLPILRGGFNFYLHSRNRK